MPSSPSDHRLEKQATGENLNTWGTRLNTVIDLLEDLTHGWHTETITGSTTLTATNYAADEARAAMLKLNGTPGATYTVTIPGVAKLQWVWNNTDATQTISAGGVTADVYVGERAMIVCDGTDCYRAVTNYIASSLTVTGAVTLQSSLGVTGAATLSSTLTMGGAIAMATNKITDLGTPTAATDAATKNYVDSTAFASALPDQTGNSGLFMTTDGSTASWASQFPSQTGEGGNFLTTDGSSVSWDTVYPAQTSNGAKLLQTNGTVTSWAEHRPASADITASQTITARLEPYYVDTTAGAVTLTLPASPADKDTVTIISGPSADENALTIARNGNTIMGISEDMTVGVDNRTFHLTYRTSDWVVW